MNTNELKQRMDRLEKELAALRAKVETNEGQWWVDQAGRFANDKEFLKIVRLGRQYRKAQKPEPRHAAR